MRIPIENATKTIAQRLFEAGGVEAELESQLFAIGVDFDRLGWDEYDVSLELHGVAPGMRLSAEAQRIIHAAGFAKVYVNHVDKWETHYSFKGREFEVVKGWRVSYPHRRGEGETSILVEEHINGWPQEWFDTGYVKIIAPCG